ncbi:MAG: hypothetical protein HN368_14010, partial [Spirochaetales bacterium]|nr:hypothetical protein [Spirochaetales bacterium]
VFIPEIREPLNVQITGPVDRYLVEVTYITQDDIGVPTDYKDIKGQIIRSTINDRLYHRWETYSIRQYGAGKSVPEYSEYLPAVGFEYFMDDLLNDDMSTLPDTSFLPRSMDGFEFFLNLIDFHMWDVYQDLFFRQSADQVPDNNMISGSFLEKPGDTIEYDATNQNLSLGSWDNVSKDLEMTAGIIYGEYIGEVTQNEIEYDLVFFRQEQTLTQTVVGLGIEMPYEGTNRFNGLMYLYKDTGKLASAWYREYVYGKVYAPMDQIIIVHNERRYSISRVR